ncbi:MAG: hypothetical protein ACOX0X_02305 [Candidatus Dojkabacteria bacterium]
MIEILLGTVGIFGVVFLEHFFWGISGLSIFFLLAVNTWGRIDSRVFAVFGILTSLALDVVAHQPLGFHLVMLGILLLLYSVISNFAQLEGRVSRYVGLFLLFLSLYFLDLIVLSLVSSSTFPLFTSNIVLKILLNTVISTVICFVIDLLFSGFREGKGFEKIRLK